ncbi:MAG: hypothetical protein J0L92_01520 [Deltaproteobacteria bacterium]|nr:hypothetical protein [Deltaproteobacteria bacterium]
MSGEPSAPPSAQPTIELSASERALAADAALTRRAGLAGWASSVLVHGTLVALVSLTVEVPDYGFEFSVPAELELGMTDVVEVEAIPPPPSPASEEPAGTNGSGPGAMDAGVPPSDGSIGDGGVPSDAPRRRRRDAAMDPDAGELLASGAGDGARPPVAFLPAGGQIALRLDLDRVRSSPVRSDVERLLGAIPDWQALLGSSGVDPVRDLSRVLVATPNLQRSSLVVAGRLTTEADAPMAIVERLIVAGGGTPQWEDVEGVPTSDWPNPDATSRRVAIVGDRHFVIARPEDLPRVLAIAAARAASDATDTPADALLALPDGAAITIEIEGARAYVRQSPCVVPTRLAARVDEDTSEVRVSLHAIFDSAEQSSEAAACFERLRARALGNPFVSFAGMGGPLGALEIETTEAALDARTSLSYGQVRTLLRYVQGMLRRPPPTTPTDPGAPTSTGVTPVPPPPITPVPPPVIPVPPPPVPPPTR